MKNLTLKEYKRVCEVHQEESWWYLFLDFGSPIDNPDYEKKFKAIQKALEAYVAYMEEQGNKLGLDELSL